MTDWNPLDPDEPRVFYDLSAWDHDQRAEVAAAFADEGIAHGWEGDELVVPEELEAQADALFDRLEAELGIVSADDTDGSGGDVAVAAVDGPVEGEPTTEYDLSEWETGERAILASALVEERIPHRWEGPVLTVPTAAEEAVDELLDQVEVGDVLILDETASSGEDGADLSTFFNLADRLRREPADAEGLTLLADVLGSVDPDAPPYGVQLALWRRAYELTDQIGDALAGDAEPDEPRAMDLAEQLHALLRDEV